MRHRDRDRVMEREEKKKKKMILSFLATHCQQLFGKGRPQRTSTHFAKVWVGVILCTPCPDSHGCWEFLRVIAPMGPKDNIAQFSPSAGSYIPSSIFSSISSMSPKTWSQGINLDIIPHLQLSTESLFFSAFWPVVYFSIDYCPLQKDQGLKQPRSIIEV